jgi:DNA adenine methylase
MNVLFPEALYSKPFLKWAGGKSQLIPAIEAALPKDIHDRKDLIYVEPFIGSGAIMFWFLQRFPNVRSAVINDINADLTTAYTTIKEEPYPLIESLKIIQNKYYRLTSEEDRRIFFLEKRDEFNSWHLTSLENTTLLIFLNRTCFNGLYRVNSKNHFNVPFGKYDKPKICDPETIIADSNILQKVTILNGDYKETLNYAANNAFFYFDPPYKPISKTSSFNSYAKDTFDDNEQIRLKHFCDELTSKGYQWLLSNSDPKNINAEDNFFDDLYSGKSIYIDRVKAKRIINSNSAKRGEIFELLISNYVPKNIYSVYLESPLFHQDV